MSLAKSIDPQPIVLIADEPTRGVDVSAKQEIYRFIKSLADIGLSCLFISSEQEEIVGMCHRVVVMKDGRIMCTLAGDEISWADCADFAECEDYASGARRTLMARRLVDDTHT